MVEKYNNTYHRSIKLKPTDARNPANYKHVHNALYAMANARKATLPYKFHVGDKVRTVHLKRELHPMGQRRYLPLQL